MGQQRSDLYNLHCIHCGCTIVMYVIFALCLVFWWPNTVACRALASDTNNDQDSNIISETFMVKSNHSLDNPDRELKARIERLLVDIQEEAKSVQVLTIGGMCLTVLGIIINYRNSVRENHNVLRL